MDLLYMPDTITYPAYRPGYNFPEQDNPWDKPKTNNNERPKHRQQSAAKDHKNCPMCKANQRRRLASYIRTKSRQNSESAIEEEDEEQTQ